MTSGEGAFFSGSMVVTNSAVFSLPFQSGPFVAERATLVLETANIRFLTTGANPDANTGLLFLSTTPSVVIEGRQNIKNFRCIATTGTAATLQFVLEAQ